MEVGLLVKLFSTAATVCFCLSTLLGNGLVIESAYAAERRDIRFYKINKDEITQKLRFTNRKARRPGCHNFLKRARLHRTVQFGYKVCRVYSKKNCKDEFLMSFYRDKEPELKTTELTQGYGWYPLGEHKRGEIVRSWFCE